MTEFETALSPTERARLDEIRGRIEQASTERAVLRSEQKRLLDRARARVLRRPAK